MAQRLTDKTALAEQTGTGDLYMVVDVSDSSGSPEGTSKKIDSQYVIQTDKFSLTNTQVKDLDTAPITLISALTGYMSTIYNVTVLCTYAAPQEIARKNLIFGFDESVDTEYWGLAADCMDAKSTDCSYVIHAEGGARNPTCAIPLLNRPFKVWAEGTGFGGGWSCDIYVTYAYTKI